MNGKGRGLLGLLTVCALCAVAADVPGGITVGELEKRLSRGEKLTVIDIRSPTLFARGHIPGAINVPASLCEQKNLPPLGKVVVCDQGLGRDESDAAVKALAAKPGISVQALEGGFATWESAQGLTSRPRGMEPEVPNYITYAQLKAAKGDDLVLVDLRKQPARAHPGAVRDVAAPKQALTDLSQEFPGKRVASSASEALGTRSSPWSGTGPLLVLVDKGDGTDQEVARTMKANGMKRYVILAGGELILARHGQAGLQRSGSAIRLPNQNAAQPH